MQILHLAHNKSDIERRVHAMIDKFAERGLRSLAVAYQVRRQCNFYLVLLSQVHYLFLCEKDHFVLSFIPLAYVHQFYAYVVLVANCSVFLI